MLVDRLRDICATSEMIGRTATERERWRPKHDPPAEASESPMRYETVLLDIDGTIADSNDAHAHAWMDALAQHGHPVEFHRIRPLIGMGGDKLLPRVAGVDSESPQGRRISETRATIFASQYLPSVTPTPGARRFVEWLNKVGVTITIATSAKAQEVTGLLSAAGVDDLIAHAATSDDADASKPDPDIVVAALKKSGSERDKDHDRRHAVRHRSSHASGRADDRVPHGRLARRRAPRRRGDLRRSRRPRQSPRRFAVRRHGHLAMAVSSARAAVRISV